MICYYLHWWNWIIEFSNLAALTGWLFVWFNSAFSQLASIDVSSRADLRSRGLSISHAGMLLIEITRWIYLHQWEGVLCVIVEVEVDFFFKYKRITRMFLRKEVRASFLLSFCLRFVVAVTALLLLYIHTRESRMESFPSFLHRRLPQHSLTLSGIATRMSVNWNGNQVNVDSFKIVVFIAHSTSSSWRRILNHHHHVTVSLYLFSFMRVNGRTAAFFFQTTLKKVIVIAQFSAPLHRFIQSITSSSSTPFTCW